MSVETVAMYRVICDGCHASAQDGDYYAWMDDESALLEATESDWIVTEDNKHYCPQCVIWDEEKDQWSPVAQPKGPNAPDPQ